MSLGHEMTDGPKKKKKEGICQITIKWKYNRLCLKIAVR